MTTSTRKRVLLISLAGDDPSLDPVRFDGIADTTDDAVWFGNRLKELGLFDAIAFRTVYAFEGEALPALEDVDAVLIGGSYHSINDRLPWQLTTMAWLERYRATGKPALGVCAGHQMMSVMFGGRVDVVEAGRCVGSLPVTLSAAGRGHYIFEDFAPVSEFNHGNTERVVEPPGGAVSLASTDVDPTVALDYGGDWVSVQFHPEMTEEVMVAYFALTHPHLIHRFHPLPEAKRMIANFLKGTGIVDGHTASTDARRRRTRGAKAHGAKARDKE
jgi:GMP synthase-like glutamine amidotransferase